MNEHDKSQRTPLFEAARKGHTNVATVLIRVGASLTHLNKLQRTALFYAAEYGQADMVRALIDAGVAVDHRDKRGRAPLFIAAGSGHAVVVEELIRRGASVDAESTDDSTPLGNAVAKGEADVVATLIQHGAAVNVMTIESMWTKVKEPLLVIAARAGHIEIFKALIEAGASVNVRGRDDETPLASIAGCGYPDGVNLLITNGSVLSSDDLAEGGVPLTSGTLRTLRKRLCDKAFEFSDMVKRLAKRAHSLCSRLKEQHKREVQLDWLTIFVSIIYRFTRVLIQIGKVKTLLARFIGSRVIFCKLRGFHEEIDDFAARLGSIVNDGGDVESNGWRADWSTNYAQVISSFHKTLQATPDEELKRTESEWCDSAIMLQYDLEQQGSKLSSSAALQLLRETQTWLPDGESAVTLPEWFLSPDDLEYHTRNKIADQVRDSVVRTDHTAKYRGKWRKTEVTVVRLSISSHELGDIADRWFALSHLNVMKLYGANHTGSHNLLAFKFSPHGTLLDFLSRSATASTTQENGCQHLTWKLLYDAALGLQYLHQRDLTHGDLLCSNIVVDADLNAKLGDLGESYVPTYLLDQPYIARWWAPEIVKCRRVNALLFHEVQVKTGLGMNDDPESRIDNLYIWHMLRRGNPRFHERPRPSFTSDVYALAMCILEAVTLEMPWAESEDQVFVDLICRGQFPRRPASLTEAQ